jgi:hypothetical protein
MKSVYCAVRPVYLEQFTLCLSKVNFRNFDITRENKRFGTEWEQEYPELNLLLESLVHAIFVNFFKKYLNFVTFLTSVLAVFMLLFCSREMNIAFVYLG